jgi:hypothetical protein
MPAAVSARLPATNAETPDESRRRDVGKIHLDVAIGDRSQALRELRSGRKIDLARHRER